MSGDAAESEHHASNAHNNNMVSAGNDCEEIDRTNAAAASNAGVKKQSSILAFFRSSQPPSLANVNNQSVPVVSTPTSMASTSDAQQKRKLPESFNNGTAQTARSQTGRRRDQPVVHKPLIIIDIDGSAESSSNPPETVSNESVISEADNGHSAAYGSDYGSEDEFGESNFPLPLTGLNWFDGRGSKRYTQSQKRKGFTRIFDPRYYSSTSDDQVGNVSLSASLSTQVQNSMEKQISGESKIINHIDLTTDSISADSDPPPKPVPIQPDTPKLTKQQRHILDLVVEQGQSLFFTGPAGVGKSFTLNFIIERLKKKYSYDSANSVAITATTGIASLHIGGTTVHSFAGIGLGADPVNVLCAKIMRFKPALDRWKSVKVWIIDEVSMLDGYLFDKLEMIARTVRKSSQPFGGIQIVVCGDFFQLPPVGKGGKDSTKFAFETDSWSSVIGKNMVELTEVFRQKDAKFVEILNQLRVNELSPANIKILQRLERPLQLQDGIEPTELYPLRGMVEQSNVTRLKALPGKDVVYQAKDYAANENLLQRLKSNSIAPEELRLRVGAQVMLLCNLDIDAGLVNGTIGKVLEFHESNNNPIIRFMVRRKGVESMVVAEIESHSWSIEEDHKIVMERRQMPLALAWAWSIHKSQGQTISYLRVNLGRTFEKGQAYVALSRAISLEQLQVLHFDPRKVMAHPKVLEFTKNILSKQSQALQ